MAKDDKKRKTTRAGQSSSSKAGKSEPKQLKKPTVKPTPAKSSKTAKAATNAAKSKPVKPTTSKSTAVPKKTAAAKKAAKAVKPVATSDKSKTPKLKPIKHSDEYENRTDGESKILVVGGKKQQKKRPSRRALKRVKAGGFTVFDGARAGKTFETEEEALNYAVDVWARTGETVAVSRTDRQVTHTFKPEEQKKK